MFAAAAEGESPWYTDDAIDSLERGAGEPGMNLDRLKLRDALLELNDALLPMLSRLSGERLHPHHDEKQRTSPWRLELDSKDRIESISIAWGAGEHAPPDFTDRPHVKVELRRHTLVVRLDTHRKTFSPPLSDGERESLGRAGFEVGDHVAKVYRLPETPPTLDTVAHLIERDLGLLVPLWIRLA